MFYGNFKDDDHEFVRGALERFARIFHDVYAADNVILFDRTLGFPPERIAFLHLDMNSSKSEIAALEILFDRVSPGGLVVFDDYGWSAYAAQQVAEDAFMRQRGHRILELPTGQGLLIKH
jgi:predicted O-methyltransferase YrrM